MDMKSRKKGKVMSKPIEQLRHAGVKRIAVRCTLIERLVIIVIIAILSNSK